MGCINKQRFVLRCVRERSGLVRCGRSYASHWLGGGRMFGWNGNPADDNAADSGAVYPY
jgi:hypothetical protein